MSTTPRTDEVAFAWSVATPRDGREMVSAEWARKLELECAVKDAQIERLRKVVEKYVAIQESTALDYSEQDWIEARQMLAETSPVQKKP